ncbi:MAG: NADH-quinone oxidoreductase subunit E [Halocynthiibacter sp.]
MLRRLHHTQPESFEFTPANLAWAEGQIAKYPAGRQASAVIPLLWRAQEQDGWVSQPVIEYVAKMLDMAPIRVFEVASFYFMFQLQPVGSVAHIQICGTTSCLICGAEDLIAVCKEKIAANPHDISADGKFSWEEVECLGACTNAPMAQIGKDYYEDLTADGFSKLLDEMASGAVPVPGPENGRYASEPLSGLTSLKDHESGKTQYNASAQRAVDVQDGLKRIDGTEVPLLTPWIDKGAGHHAGAVAYGTVVPAKPAHAQKAAVKKAPAKKAPAKSTNASPAPKAAAGTSDQKKPRTMKAPRKAGADDLKKIKGVGPKLEALLHSLGFYHFDQVAKWTSQEVAWVDDNLEGFRGRVSRDNWVAQATVLADGGETEFSKKVDKGSVY